MSAAVKDFVVSAIHTPDDRYVVKLHGWDGEVTELSHDAAVQLASDLLLASIAVRAAVASMIGERYA